jgi:Lysyl oxidase
MSRVRKFATALVVMAAGLATSSPATAAPTGASLEIVRASPTVTLDKYPGSPVYFDVGAYVASVGGSFRLNVTRNGYRSPIAVTQVLSGGTRTLPAWVANGWDGMSRFVHYTVRNASGRVVYKLRTAFCPDGFDLQRLSPSGPLNPTFPEFCGDNPFTLGAVWGIDRGWAVGLDDTAPSIPLAIGRYSVIVSIPPRYAALFRIPAAHARTTIAVNVVKAPPCCAAGRKPLTQPAGSPTLAPTVTHPSPATEPDLVALPSWGISTEKQAGREYLDFGATVWDHGSAAMDIEGFRRPGTGIMDAYQYFFKDGRPVGRAKVGILEYDSDPGHEHWHFQQFVRYSLLNSNRSLVVRSQKDGFCLAPTDAIDLVQHGAMWNPGQLGFSGACGDQTALWTRETLPSGWGDTYEQTLPGQSFDITDLPNGTYYISIEANPLGAIHEVRTNNDTSLRRVILGGTPGKRTVRVPAWNGIDPEG